MQTLKSESKTQKYWHCVRPRNVVEWGNQDAQLEKRDTKL